MGTFAPVLPSLIQDPALPENTFIIMACFTRLSRSAILAVALTLGLSANFLQPVQAQWLTSSLGSKLENSFRPPRGPNAPSPVNTVSGGRRGGPCMISQNPLIALVPTYGGKTKAEYPTIYWYVPGMSADAPAPVVEFELTDANNREVYYSAKYSLTKSAQGVVGSPGIMSLKLDHPDSLKIGQTYRWQLTLRCDANEVDHSQDHFVEGLLERVAPDQNLVNRIQQATPQERIALYADNDLWYEALGTLIELRRERPNDVNVANAWDKLLSFVQKGDIVAKEALFNGARSINNY